MKKYIIRCIKSKKGKKYTHEYFDSRNNILSKNDYEPLIKNLYIAPAYDKVKINLNKNDKVLAIGVDEEEVENNIPIIQITFKKQMITNIKN